MEIVPIKKLQTYEFGIQGMRCANCSGNIEKNVKVIGGVSSLQINFITEKMLINIYEESETINQIKETIQKLGFKITYTNNITSDDTNSQRRLVLDKIIMNQQQQYQLLKLDNEGIINYQQDNTQITINYNPNIIKSYDILQLLNEQGIQYNVVNTLVRNFRNQEKYKQDIAIQDLTKCIILTLFLVFLTMILPQFDAGMSIMQYPNILGVFSIYTLIILCICTYTIYKYGLHFYSGAYKTWKFSRSYNMETLITIGSLAAYVFGVYQLIIGSITTLTYDNEVYIHNEYIYKCIMSITHMFETSAIIITIIMIGKYFEGKAKQSISNRVMQIYPEAKLFAKTTYTYVKLKNKKLLIAEEKSYDSTLLEKDDFIQVTQGEILLNDCVVIGGEFDVVDTVSFGELKIEKAQTGDKLKSGTEIIKGSGILKIENVIEKSMIFEVSHQMTESMTRKIEFQNAVDKISRAFVPTIIFISIVVLITWSLLIVFKLVTIQETYLFDLGFAIEKSIAVLVVSCPCALGLAIPTVVTIALNLAVGRGILIKNSSSLEKCNQIKTVIFDKTGTLLGDLKQVNNVDIINTEQFSPYTLWAVIGTLEQNITHPIAELLYKETIKQCDIFLLDNGLITIQKNTRKAKENGVQADICISNNIYTAYIGNYKYILDNNIQDIKQYETRILQQQQQQQSIVILVIENRVQMIISIDTANDIKPEAKSVISILKQQQQKKCYILSGDHVDSVTKTGQLLDVSLDKILGGNNSHQKKNFLKDLISQQGNKVMMIGDGLNDIMSLAEATIGVAINAKSELNLLAADVVLLSDDLTKILDLFTISKYALLLIKLNLLWAFIYNIAAIPIAAGIFYHSLGLQLSPMISSLPMSLSSILILISSNSLRLLNLNQSLSTPTHNNTRKQSPRYDVLEDEIITTNTRI